MIGLYAAKYATWKYQGEWKLPPPPEIIDLLVELNEEIDRYLRKGD